MTPGIQTLETEGESMKGKRKKIVSLLIVTLIILIPLMFSTPTILAGNQTRVSFLPVSNEPPVAPINNYPINGSVNISIPVPLEVLVYDTTSDSLDVYFYNASNSSLIGIDYNVQVPGYTIGTATVNWSGLGKGITYSWYAVANDSEYENTSEIWNFTTRPNQPPIIHNNEYPANKSTNVGLQITCHIEVSDEDEDTMDIYWYENSNGDWVLRQTDSSVNNGIYYWTFIQANSYSTTYYWKVIVDDGTCNTTAIYNFTTKPKPSSPSPPPNKNPTAKIICPNIGYVNESLLFCAHYSYDPDGSIISYRWDFNNDGLFDTDWEEESSKYHIYSTPGNYTVKLQVKDDDNAISMDSYVITIIGLEPDQQPPVAQINDIYEGFTNENITFSGADCYDPDGRIVTYIWDFGDYNTSNLKNPVHTYSKPGDYVVVLTVIDNDNLTVMTIATVHIKDKEIKILPLLPLTVLIISTISIALTLLYKRYQINCIAKNVEMLKKNLKKHQMRMKHRVEDIKAKVDKLVSKLKYKTRNKK